MPGGRKTVWDLALQISGDDKGASAALQNVRKQIADVQKAGQTLGKDFRAFAGNAGKLALGVVGGVTAAGAGVFAMANSFARAGDQVAKTADAMNMSIEGYQRLRWAMADSGIEAKQFDYAMRRMTNMVNQGAAGNEQMARKLEEVGLCAQRLAQMRPEQAFERISDFMNTLPDEASRANMAIQLFGRNAGPQMALAMRQGSQGIQALGDEAKKLGLIMTEEQARASEEFGNQFSRLRQVFTVGLRNVFIGGSIEPITKAMSTLKSAIADHLMPIVRELGQRFSVWLTSAVQRLPEIIARVRDFATSVAAVITRVKDFAGGWRNLGIILAGLAIAPTFLSGLKVIWSLGNLIHVTFKAVPAIIGKIAPALKAVGKVLLVKFLPITAIIAGLAAVVFTVIRNFDVLRDHVLASTERIRSAFGSLTGGMSADWQKIAKIARAVLDVIESGVLFVIKTVINVITSVIQIVIGAFRVLFGVIQGVSAIIETVARVAVALFQGDFAGAIQAVSNLFTRLGKIGENMFGGLLAIVGGLTGFIKSQFENSLNFVTGIIGSLADRFGGVFNTIRDIVDSFISFFTGKFQGIQKPLKRDV